MTFNIIVWLKKRPTNAQADAAFDAGLKDPEWVLKGGRMFLDFNRPANSWEDAAKSCVQDIEKHGLMAGQIWHLIDGETVHSTTVEKLAK